MGDERIYRILKYTAIAMGVSWILWTLYEFAVVKALDPAQSSYSRAVRDFKDGRYDVSLKFYEETLQIDPEHEGAWRGKADSLSFLGNHRGALEIYSSLIRKHPDSGIYYANRGIIYDRIGSYRNAISDYENAYALNQKLDKGPGWLTRFLRNQADKPPTIVERANYLKYQLGLPADERVLRVPQEDAKQRPYTSK